MGRKLDIAAVAQEGGSNYPTPFDGPCRGSTWRRLGRAAGLTAFGVYQLALGAFMATCRAASLPLGDADGQIDEAVAGEGDDLAGAMDSAPVLQDRPERQRIVLHRAERHGRRIDLTPMKNHVVVSRAAASTSSRETNHAAVSEQSERRHGLRCY